MRFITIILTSLAVAISSHGYAQTSADSQYPRIDQWQFDNRATTIVKLNAAYALVGVVNPQVEFRLSPHSSFQTEVVYSPWRSLSGRHMHFGIFLNEYRYFISRSTRGLYVGANGGIMAFDMSRPELLNGKISLQNRYCKGYGLMLGAVVGYQWQFAKRWIMDFYIGFAYTHSKYNGYSMDGVINMHPSRPEDKQPLSPDPWNSSAEWLPNKVGISFGFLL